jgi:hypothetical protein
MKSRIYRDLTTKKLNEVTIDDLDTFRQGFYAQGRKNKAAYDELQQVAIASNQQGGSGSVPGTSIIVEASNVFDNKTTLYAPNVGTWILEAVSFVVTGGAGFYTHDIDIQHTSGAEMLVFHDIKDAADKAVFRTQLEFDSNITIRAFSTGSSTPTDITAFGYLMRRR